MREKMQNPNVVFSILLFGGNDENLRFITEFHSIMSQGRVLIPFRPTVVIRNNMPIDKECDLGIRDLIENLNCNYPFHYINETHNQGFGRGHNKTLEEYDTDIFCVLNNDIFFSNFSWFESILEAFSDSKVGLVGPLDSPSSLNPITAAGSIAKPHEPSLYAEGSILFIRASAAKLIGPFDDNIKFAYFEDSALSLKFQLAGWKIILKPIPHQHFRSTSSNRLPSAIRQSVYEHNKAYFFKEWNISLVQQTVYRTIHFDLVSDGLGDVIAAFPHVLSIIEKHKTIDVSYIISIKNRELTFLFNWLPNTRIRIVSSGVENGVPNIGCEYSLRKLPYQLPFNLHLILDAYIGEVSKEPELLKKFLDNIVSSTLFPFNETYTVLHFEYLRNGWEGRGFDLDAVLEHFRNFKTKTKLVLIGQVLSDEENFPTEVSDFIVDLRGKVGLYETFTLIKGAKNFIGIDSAPLHIAQLFGLPVFGFFGATAPESRLWNSEYSTYWVNDSLQCLGCYHRYIRPDYNYCMRRDEECLNLASAQKLGEQLEKFCLGKYAKKISRDDKLHSHQVALIRLMAFNPIYKHTLLSHSLYERDLSDSVNSILKIVEDGMFNRASAVTRKLVEENLQLRDALKETERIKTSAIPRRQVRKTTAGFTESMSTFFDQGHLLTIENFQEKFVQLNDLELIADESSVAHFESNTIDPRIFINKEIQVVAPIMRLRVRAVTEILTMARVYVYLVKDRSSYEVVARGEVALEKGVNHIDLVVDVSSLIGEDVYIRYDPVEYVGNFSLFGLHILSDEK
jgi:hypothetical protein